MCDTEELYILNLCILLKERKTLTSDYTSKIKEKKKNNYISERNRKYL